MTYIGVLPFLRRSMVIIIRENVPLAPYTYFKIGGSAQFFVEAHNEEEMCEALAFTRTRGVPFWILGGGSNMLIADEGLPGLAIRIMMNDVRADGEKMVYGAGMVMARAVAASVEHGLTGFEWAIGIPGTIGGSVRGNAGCFGGETKDVVESVRIFDTKNTKRYTLNAKSCNFDYRESMFKHDHSLIILSATLKLKKGDPEESKKLITRYAKERTQKQDIGAQCAGCMFKNFIPPSGAVISAGWLIDTAGLKGARVGNAMVSEKHANYFINGGGAKAEDVRALAHLVKKRVRAAHGIELEEEIQLLP